VRYLRHTKTKIRDSPPQYLHVGTQKMLNLWQKKKKRDEKVKLLNEFLNETQSPLNLEASEEEKGCARERNG